MTSTRVRLLPAVTAVALALPLLTAIAPGTAAAASCDVYPAPEFGDLDQDGLADTAYGVPGRTVDGRKGAGAVVVKQTRAGTVVLTLHRLGIGPVAAGDGFGTAVSTAATRGADGCSSSALVVSAPGHAGGRGTVAVFTGSATGVIGGPVASYTATEAGARLGSALSMTTVGVAEIVSVQAGAPGADVGAAADAGAVHTLNFATGATTGVVASTLTLDSPGVPGTPEKGDRFGSVLSPRGPVYGIPRKDVGRKSDAGMLLFRRGSTPRWYLVRQGRDGVPGTAEKGDRFGAAVDGTGWSVMVVGSPGEDFRGVRNAGTATVLSAVREARVLRQRPGARLERLRAENGDRFGSSVAHKARFDESDSYYVGVPGEDVGRKKDAGQVDQFTVHDGPRSRVTYDEASRLRTARAGDELGATMMLRRSSDTAAQSDGFVRSGAPGRDLSGVKDAGAMLALGEPDTVITVGTLGVKPEAGDRFGAAIGSQEI